MMWMYQHQMAKVLIHQSGRQVLMDSFKQPSHFLLVMEGSSFMVDDPNDLTGFSNLAEFDGSGYARLDLGTPGYDYYFVTDRVRLFASSVLDFGVLGAGTGKIIGGILIFNSGDVPIFRYPLKIPTNPPLIDPYVFPLPGVILCQI